MTKLTEDLLFTLAASLYRVSRWYRGWGDACYLRASVMWGRRRGRA